MKKARVHKIHLITIDKTTNDKVHSKPKLWVHVNEVMLAAKWNQKRDTILSKKVSCIVMIFHINIPNFPLSFFLSRLSSFSSSTFSAEYMTSVRSAYFLPERTAESSCKMSCWYIRTEPIYQRNFKVFKYSSLESWHRKNQFLIKKMSVICWIK